MDIGCPFWIIHRRKKSRGLLHIQKNRFSRVLDRAIYRPIIVPLPIFSLVERNDSSYIYIVSHTIGPILPLERHWRTSPHEEMTTRQTPKRENFKLIRRYPWSPSLRCEKWNVSMRKDSRLSPARAVISVGSQIAQSCSNSKYDRRYTITTRPNSNENVDRAEASSWARNGLPRRSVDRQTRVETGHSLARHCLETTLVPYTDKILPAGRQVPLTGSTEQVG